MTTKKSLFIAALLLPILILATWIGYIDFDRNHGMRFTLPISGYDPFDVLRGHYLIYRVDYELSDLCRKRSKHKRDDSLFHNKAYICLEPRKFSYTKPRSHCLAFIEGYCRYRRFIAGIERFYIPQAYAKPLEKAIRGNRASIQISAGKHGRGYVTNLLINDMSWKDYIKTKE